MPSPDVGRKPLTIALLSYNRPVYFGEVLSSLKPQLCSGDEVLVFQDGGWNPHSQSQKATDEAINECVAIFDEVFNTSKPRPYCASVFRSPMNLGIAGNYRRAESYVFEELDRQSAVLLEDDLVLGPHYLSSIAQLLVLANAEPRIGYVSAYGDFWASVEQQRKRKNQLAPMHENWGSALTKRSWLAQKPVRDRYWEFVKDIDYSSRDHEAIRTFYERLGYRCRASSQDASRWVACSVAGMTRITTATCHARYIGATGEHATPDYYERYRFADAQIFPEKPIISMPKKRVIEGWLRASRDNFTRGYVHSYQKGDPESAGPGERSSLA